MTDVSLVKLPSDECNWILLMICQHWFRKWPGAVRQQAITWASVDPDLCRQMASLGHNELTLDDVEWFFKAAEMMYLVNIFMSSRTRDSYHSLYMACYYIDSIITSTSRCKLCKPVYNSAQIITLLSFLWYCDGVAIIHRPLIYTLYETPNAVRDVNIVFKIDCSWYSLK